MTTNHYKGGELNKRAKDAKITELIYILKYELTHKRFIHLHTHVQCGKLANYAAAPQPSVISATTPLNAKTANMHNCTKRLATKRPTNEYDTTLRTGYWSFRGLKGQPHINPSSTSRRAAGTAPLR